MLEAFAAVFTYKTYLYSKNDVYKIVSTKAQITLLACALHLYNYHISVLVTLILWNVIDRDVYSTYIQEPFRIMV